MLNFGVGNGKSGKDRAATWTALFEATSTPRRTYRGSSSRYSLRRSTRGNTVLHRRLAPGAVRSQIRTRRLLQRASPEFQSLPGHFSFLSLKCILLHSQRFAFLAVLPPFRVWWTCFDLRHRSCPGTASTAGVWSSNPMSQALPRESAGEDPCRALLCFLAIVPLIPNEPVNESRVH